MKLRHIACTLFLSLAFAASASSAADRSADLKTIERGRYLVMIGACNDCHTPGYPEAAGKLPERDWLTGNSVGFQGPWGTSYPSNLRLRVQQMSEAQWLERARTPMLPPMPWFNLRDMTSADLLALYRYIRALGPAGESAPAATAPGTPVATPYIEFFPKNLPQQALK